MFFDQVCQSLEGFAAFSIRTSGILYNQIDIFDVRDQVPTLSFSKPRQ